MSGCRTLLLVLLALGTVSVNTNDTAAGEYRIRFQGVDPSAPPGTAQSSGYIGLNNPQNLSVPTPLAPVPGSDYHGAGVPNQIVTFLHPFTNRAVTVPLTLPTGRPTIRTRGDRIIYDYGLFSYKVIVHFLNDGEVEVIYRG